jgi:hypothetical protein
MDFILRVTVGPNPRALNHHGNIVGVETDTDVLFHPEGDTSHNALVDADTLATDILDLFRTWASSHGELWTVTAVEEVQ